MTTATLEHPARKGHYIAAVESDSLERGALSPIGRTFLKGAYIKGSKAFRHNLEPGWYERQTMIPARERCAEVHGCGCRDDGKRRDYFAVTPAGEYIELAAIDPAGTATPEWVVAGPLPLEPGTWNGERCHCGADVTGYTPQGFPHCDDHAPTNQTATATDTEGLIAA